MGCKQVSRLSRYDVTVAVIGNPNVGKSTLFNAITGELAHVSNWPGTTVALKEGFKEWKGIKIRFVDLPGIYGLSASSLEEVVSREYLIGGEANLIIALVDSTAPERSLYLPLQLLELTPNVVIAFTKVDEMSKLGIHINFSKLRSLLGVPVIPTSAINNVGIRELLDTIVEFVKGIRPRDKALVIDYGGLEPFIDEVSQLITRSKVLSRYPARWVAIRLLEGDPRLEELLMAGNELEVLKDVQKIREAVRRSIGRDPADLIISSRYNYINDLVHEVVVRVKGRANFIDVVGRVIQRPTIGPIISLLILLVGFFAIFSINSGFPLNIIFRSLNMHWLADFIEEYSLNGIISRGFDALSSLIKESLTGSELLSSFIADGILVGVGAVVAFLPLIFLASLFMALLEDSGLAPRMAVGFHNLFSRFGLSGRAIYPLILGLGCNVPAVMSSRTALDDVERKEIILAAPFIPCQARLIVTMAFITAYFRSPVIQTLTLISIYSLGILYYLITSSVVRKFVYRVPESPELVLELPLIHIPKPRIVWWISWEYTKHFLRKAGLIIFSLSVFIWVLLNVGPGGFTSSPEASLYGVIGRALAPMLKPLDIIGDTSWKIGTALLQGFIAKEAVLETLAILEGTSDIGEALSSLELTMPQVIALLIFINMYVPCMATVAMEYSESKSLKLTALQALLMTVIAYVTSLTTYYIVKLMVV